MQMMTALLFSTWRTAGRESGPGAAAAASSAADHGPRRARAETSETSAPRSCRWRGEVTDANEVVGGEGEGEHPVHAADPGMPRLTHQSDRLEPAEDLLHALAPLLADRVARMPSGATVDRAGAMAGVLRDMRGHSEQAHRRDEIARVIALVGSERDASAPIERPQQVQRRGPFGVAAGRKHAATD